MATANTSVWDKRISKAEKFLEKSREHGRNVYRRYKDDREDDVIGMKRVNIFYANVNTIKESLFNSLPKPDVSRLHKGDYEDDAARVAALVLQRGLTYEINCAKSFEAAIKYAILDRLVPGIGQVWLRFAEPESIFIDVLYWEDFLYGPARCWDLVPWVGRRIDLSKQDFIDTYGQDAFNQASQVKDTSNITAKEISDGKYCVYEIWEKKTKKVFHVVKGAERPIKELDDPYGLPDFFPCPCPLIANITTSEFLPVTDYHLAQDQYNELDVLYARMSLISKAVKVAGVYDASATGIKSMLEGQENMLIPVENWAMYAEGGGAKGLIDWYPIEQVVGVFESLSTQYGMIKATLYEVTGMSDIMRGASNQYETAAAQEIKAQFASVRMNGYQRDVSQFVKGILNIMGQLMCNLYSNEKFQQIVGALNQADMQLIPMAEQVLRSPEMRKYKVDIEADSLTQSDWALEKGQRMELIGYISQLLTSAVPAIKETPELGSLLLSMIKFGVAGFKGAAEIEGILDQQLSLMLAAANDPNQQQEKPPSPEEVKAQAEQQKLQGEMQLKTQESNGKMQIEQMQAQADIAVQNKKLENDLFLKQEDMKNKRELHAMDIQMKREEMAFKREEQRIKLESLAVSSTIKTEQQQQQLEMKNEQSKSESK